ncbi:hypothetical protein A3843_17965 [Pseudovibrio exalbescens]|uniref:Uncharacterized protein n=2 Tax=Pseudovibrio exalbescens TaxID=197461 RepID=A0A1U7JCV1_9HYPH|nr:hypothetical protein A3843_17965 [Pseudovibrio exalbescens]
MFASYYHLVIEPDCVTLGQEGSGENKMDFWSRVGAVLLALMVLLFAVNTGQAGDVPRRLVLGTEFYYPPGESKSQGVEQALDRMFGDGDYKVPVPPEVAAFGFEVGGSHLLTRGKTLFAQWPYLVLQDGQPIAVTNDRQAGLTQTEFPDEKTLRPIPQIGAISMQRTKNGLMLIGTQERGRGKVTDDGAKGFAIDVTSTTVIPGREGGCFRTRMGQETWVYFDGTSEPFHKTKQNNFVSDQVFCLSVAQTKPVDGMNVHLIKVEANGHWALSDDGTAKSKERTRQTAYALGFSPLTSPRSSGGDFIVAQADLEWRDQQALERVDGFAAAVEHSILENKWSLARDQIISLNDYLADLKRRGVQWSWRRTPTQAGVDRYNKLVKATKVYRFSFMEVQNRLADVQSQLHVLRHDFSTDVLKTMLRSTVNWLNVVPTDPLDGLAEYSDLAGVLALPKTLMSWKEEAATDGSLLASQVKAIRHFEKLEKALQARQDHIIAARKALFERIKETQAERALTLDELLSRP